MSEAFSLTDTLSGKTIGADFTGSDLMQFTGLHDNNGKEIYEGDIVRYTVNGTDVGEVWWQDARGVWVIDWTHSPDEYKDVQIEYSRELTIIGNIYENPELLENSLMPESLTAQKGSDGL